MLGRIASMEINHKAVEKAKKGDDIALKIEATNAEESAKLYGRHFDFKVNGLAFWLHKSGHDAKFKFGDTPASPQVSHILSLLNRFTMLR